MIVKNIEKHRGEISNKHFKPMWGILLVLVVLIINPISAELFQFDNVKSYDSETETITITDTFGLGKDIAELRLITPHINKVKTSKDILVAEFRIELFEDYNDAFGDMEFYNLKNDWEKINKVFVYKYSVIENVIVDDYKNVLTGYYPNGTAIYDSQIVGNHKELQKNWYPITENNFLEGELNIGIFTEVFEGDYIEWIPSIFGKTIDEWASYEAEVTDAHGNVQGNTDPGVTTAVGGALVPQFNVLLTKVTAEPATTGNTAIVYYGGNLTILAENNSAVNDEWLFDVTLNGDDLYIIEISSDGAPYTATFKSAGAQSFPIVGTNMDYVWGSTTNGTGNSTQVQTLKSVTTRKEIADVAPNITLNNPPNNTNSTSNIINFGGVVFDNINLLNVSLILDDIYNETNSSGINNTNYTFTKTLADGTYTWTYEGCDNVSLCANGTIRTFTVDTINPAITLTAPPALIESHSIGDSLNLNWTVIDTNLFACWYNYNNTNTTVTCGDNTTTFNTVEDEQNITFYANDSSGNENLEVTSWIYSFLETGVSFNGNVSETSSQSFEINVATGLTVLSISAILNYNGTNHTSSASCVSGDCTILNTIDIPLVSIGDNVLYDFFWDLTIFNGTDSSSITTSTRNQNVSRIYLEECNATFTVKALNFTSYDEQNLTRIDPFLFDGTFDQWLGSGSVKRQTNFSQSSTSDEDLCISPYEKTYFIDSTIEYDEVGNSTTYTLRNYYFQNDTISNSSQDIFLYLLKSASATSFILKVQDDSLLPIENALIEINRFYPGTNEFRVVQIAKTDDNGKSVGFFETEIVDYKFFITLQNIILLETGLQKVIPEVSPFTLTFNTGVPLGEPWESQNDIDDLNSSLEWDKTSGIVTYSYIDSSNEFALGRLLVIKESLTNASENSIICDVNSSLISSTLTCNVGSTQGFYLASTFITRDSTATLDKQISFQIETLSDAVGFLGLFYGWFLILIASFMFKFNEIAGIWAITITMFLVNLTGLINFGGVFITAIIGVSIILTWILEN